MEYMVLYPGSDEDDDDPSLVEVLAHQADGLERAADGMSTRAQLIRAHIEALKNSRLF